MPRDKVRKPLRSASTAEWGSHPDLRSDLEGGARWAPTLLGKRRCQTFQRHKGYGKVSELVLVTVAAGQKNL